MSERARLLVIQHEDAAPLAWWEEWLAADLALDVCRPDQGEPVPVDLLGYGGLLVLGGAMGAYDDAPAPWLPATKQLIADTIAKGRQAFLGICLGHQLAAVATGGIVARNPRGTTVGTRRVGLTPAARMDPFLRDVRPRAVAVHWNGDVVTSAPPGSTVLALAPDETIQAVRYGPLAWGVQFHPEASPDVVARWGVAAIAQAAAELLPGAVTAGVAEVSVAEPELRAAWRPLAERFARLVQSSQDYAGPEPDVDIGAGPDRLPR